MSCVKNTDRTKELVVTCATINSEVYDTLQCMQWFINNNKSQKWYWNGTHFAVIKNNQWSKFTQPISKKLLSKQNLSKFMLNLTKWYLAPILHMYVNINFLYQNLKSGKHTPSHHLLLHICILTKTTLAEETVYIEVRYFQLVSTYHHTLSHHYSGHTQQYSLYMYRQCCYHTCRN